MKRIAWITAGLLTLAVGAGAASRVVVSGTPLLRTIPGTNVYRVRNDQNYDMFRFAGTWYVTNDGSWYRSSSYRGPYVMVRDDAVPPEVMGVPAASAWRSGDAMSDRNDDRWRDENRGFYPSDLSPPEVHFRGRPHLMMVPGTRVMVVRDADADYDMFRFGRTWYVYDTNGWWRASTYRGPFRSVDERFVPGDILSVPASNWRNYPENGWRSRHDRDWDRRR